MPYQTRSKTKMEEIAHILVQLSQAPPAIEAQFAVAELEPEEVQPVQWASPLQAPQEAPMTPPMPPLDAPTLSDLDTEQLTSEEFQYWQEQSRALLRAPQSVPRLGRSLSHSEEARARAEAVAPQTKPGDTILMNFFIDRNGYTTLQYMKNVNGTMVVHGIEGPEDILTIPWTFVVTDFGF